MLSIILSISLYVFLSIGIIGLIISLFPMPYRQPIQIISAICLTLGVFQYGQQVERQDWELKVAQLNTQIVELETKSQIVTTKVITEYVDRVKIVKERSDEIIVKVPVYIDKYSDDACVVNNGFVLLHDYAAKNQVPDAPGNSYAEASGVKLSTVAETVTTNYGTCYQIKQQLESLQQWVIEQQKINND